MSTASIPTESEFLSLGAHPRLAAALAARGYETPTAVQAAVLEAPDADLLVSSETGSGKTVAFGLLLARALLGEKERIEPSTTPRALVVAPTRELAVQVERELRWLLTPTGARTLPVTGGTDLRLDARALARGVDIVVGTPGRLVDLLERKSLDLSLLSIVVLDEADEMLDMGFRESLEAILDRAPAERRTLLFSATLPAGIRSLAQRYQRDAVSIDPRRGGATAHADIRHVAYLCARGERLAALVNVLRLHDGERAILFCRTREGVAELHRQLTLRGFPATAISGERAQAERTRALDALRKERVGLLVATNVAARGLDLPDLGLVVHYDLPENVEALTHRSGRTGRAGKKGVSAIVVEESERRRAERLFADAKLQLKWSTPPAPAAIAAHDRARLRRELEEGDLPSSAASAELAAELLSTREPEDLVARLLERELARRPPGEALTPVDPTRKSAAPSPRRSPSPSEMVLFEVNLGSSGNAKPDWILPLVCRRGGVTRKDVGAIRVEPDRTLVEIAAAAADSFAEAAAEIDPRAPHVRVARSTATLPRRPFSTAPAGKPRPTTHRKGAHAAAPAGKGAHASSTDGKPYAPSPERKPYASSPERKPFASSPERKPYASSHERKPHASSPGGKPHAGRPHALSGGPPSRDGRPGRKPPPRR